MSPRPRRTSSSGTLWASGPNRLSMKEYDASRIVRCAPAVVGANVNESRSVSISSGLAAAVRSSRVWATAFSTVAAAAIAAIVRTISRRPPGNDPGLHRHAEAKHLSSGHTACLIGRIPMHAPAMFLRFRWIDRLSGIV